MQSNHVRRNQEWNEFLFEFIFIPFFGRCRETEKQDIVYPETGCDKTNHAMTLIEIYECRKKTKINEPIDSECILAHLFKHANPASFVPFAQGC